MKTIQEILVAHAFFKGLESAYVELIAGCGSNLQFEKGQMICKAGDDANHFYVIRSGKVAIELSVPGRGDVVLQTLREGDILGWSWLFPPYTWNFGARALESTRVTALDGKCLRGKCDKDHSLGYELMKRFAKIMTERLQATRIQLLDLYGPSKC